jgi:hypothetical protein
VKGDERWKGERRREGMKGVGGRQGQKRRNAASQPASQPASKFEVCFIFATIFAQVHE